MLLLHANNGLLRPFQLIPTHGAIRTLHIVIPRSITVSNPREAMATHRKDCPLEMVQCEYHNMGCEERMKRKDVERHNTEKMKEQSVYD